MAVVFKELPQTDDDQPINLATPALLLDRSKLDRNIAGMRTRLAAAGGDIVLRPHLKTAKSIEVALRMVGDASRPITVSTLLEADKFADAGFADILYAVGIAPAKLGRVLDLRRRGIDLAIVTDNLRAAEAIATAAGEANDAIPVLIEIDCDGHRSGIRQDDHALLVQIANILAAGGAEVRGVMTHAGGSYDMRTPVELETAAANECAAALAAATALRAAGFPAPVVSIGSTPTALSAHRLDGITEVRAGVFAFFDLVMAGIGVCSVDDIAISVLATVIGHQSEKGWIIVDAGWMAMSRDRGTAAQPVDQGYGLVCDATGRPYPDIIMTGANQEHGILAVRPGAGAPLPDLPVGAQVRILPNHACSTAAQHAQYHVVAGNSPEVLAEWPRFSGW